MESNYETLLEATVDDFIKELIEIKHDNNMVMIDRRINEVMRREMFKAVSNTSC
jgi:hypothetical protein